MELFIGKLIKAKWDNQTSKIIFIKKNIITYQCLVYKNKHSINGYFKNTIEIIKEHFIDIVK